MEGCPCTEYAGADHDDVRSGRQDSGTATGRTCMNAWCKRGITGHGQAVRASFQITAIAMSVINTRMVAKTW